MGLQHWRVWAVVFTEGLESKKVRLDHVVWNTKCDLRILEGVVFAKVNESQKQKLAFISNFNFESSLLNRVRILQPGESLIFKLWKVNKAIVINFKIF